MINITDLSISSINRALTKLSRQICCSNGGGDARPYKVYTALLTQNGGDDVQSISSGAVTKGVTYMVDGTSSDADFSNVGGPKYDGVTSINGTYFVAINNDIPNNYSEGDLIYNTGAPVVTVLENTIGNIWFGFGNDGFYTVFSDGLFILDKTYVYIGDSNSGVNNGVLSGINKINSNQIQINTVLFDTSGVNDELTLTPIEIRVYY